MAFTQVQRTIGIVYDPSGRPRIEKDFIDHLLPEERDYVDNQLAQRGFQITPQGLIKEII